MDVHTGLEEPTEPEATYGGWYKYFESKYGKRVPQIQVATAAAMEAISDGQGQEEIIRQGIHAAARSCTRDGQLRKLIVEGTKLELRKHWLEASRYYEEALEQDPGFTDAMLRLGHCHTQLGNPGLAATQFENYVSLLPGNNAIATLAGKSYVSAGDPEAAVPFLRAALRTADPDQNANQRASLARVYILLGEFEAALALVEGISVESGRRLVGAAQAVGVRAAAKYLLGRRDEALQDMDLVLRETTVTGAQAIRKALAAGGPVRQFDEMSVVASPKPPKATKAPPASKVSDRVTQIGDSFSVKGRNGTLTITPTKVIIQRKGAVSFLSQGFKGDNEIRIDQITAVRFRKNGRGVVGYISFGFMGGQQFTGGQSKAVSNENTILFARNAEPGFLRAKDLIEEYQQRLKQGPTTAPATSSSLDELEKLASLRDKGIVTAEEFEKKKKQLLGL